MTDKHYSRRDALKLGLGVVATAAVAPMMVSRKAQAAEVTTLTVADVGGPYGTGFGKAFYRPFEEATGIKIINTVLGPDPVPQFQMMVDTKNYLFDVALLNPEHLVRLNKLGKPYLEDLHIQVPDPQNYVKGAITPQFGGVSIYALALGYRTDTFAQGNAPTNWTDFWNTTKFKGRRGLWRSPVCTLELALMADGVAPDKLYPLDVDRAFRSLDKIRSSIDIWWTSGAQATQMLQSGELDMMSIWSTRAQTAIDAGTPASIAWGQGLYNIDGFTIPHGSPKVDAARKFVQFCMDAKRQSLYTSDLACGPTTVKAYDFIDKQKALMLPTAPDHIKGLALLGADYWGEHQVALTERFEKWVIS
ncbi:ABC transporter substrate-binding protein [Erwinia sp. BNK-24-b]|uniref:ABC transporter substrate-binding protein n=1 Tax=Erwinia TaxID=551 RepID=UPI001FED6E44|nr:ABC transporter substrate-binding protein [Erwinia phyllosphaerae]MBV4367181.1 ABC transporter substrate-binding protein [Erwinia phyllosphaerae]